MLLSSCQEEPKVQNKRGFTSGSSNGVAASSGDLEALERCENDRSLTLKANESQSKMLIVNGDVAEDSDDVTASTVKVHVPGAHCTGTLIGPNQIVTAAHCFEESRRASPNAPLNFLDFPSEIKIGMGVNGNILGDVVVEAFVPHPCYQGILANTSTGKYLDQIYYDVGLISFSGDLPNQYQPVEVAEIGDIQASSSVIIAGYGAYSDSDTQRRPLTQVESRISSADQFDEIQLEINGGGACFGDSGGPTYIRADGKLKVAGSTTGPGRDSNYTCAAGSGTMMDLSKYRRWMKCSFQQMQVPLDYLSDEDSSSFCEDNRFIR